MGLFNRKTFFFLGILLLTFDNFPFGRYGLGNNHCLSFYPMILYILLNIKYVFRALQSADKCEIVMIFGLLGMSLWSGMFRFHDLEQCGHAVNMWISYFIALFSFRIFIFTANRKDVFLMFKLINVSFTISLMFGLLEFVFFYVVHLEFIKSFLCLFLRDDVFFDVMRIQFNFQEAGTTGFMLLCLYLPSLITYCKMGHKLNKMDRIKLIGFIFLSLFSFSNTFFLTSFALLIFYVLNKLSVRKNIKNIILICLILLSCLPFIVSQLKTYNNGRLYDTITSPLETMQREGSFGTRGGLWVVSLYAAKDYPLTGYGWGYFSYALKNHLGSIVTISSEELFDKVFVKNQDTYSLYTTALVEGGILGVIWLIFLVYTRYKCVRKSMRPFYFTYLFSLLQIIPIYVPCYMYILYLMSDRKINAFLADTKKINI